MPRLRISTPAGFNFPATVQSHGWYSLAPFEWSESSGRLVRPEEIEPGIAVDLTIHWDGALILESGSPLRPFAGILGERMRRMFQLDLDLAEFHRMCETTPSHRTVATSGFGRLLCGSTAFEDAVKIIATTNTTWRQTVRMVANLVAIAGTTTPVGRVAFPSPAAVSRLSLRDLEEECRFGYRSRYVLALADGLQDGTLAMQWDDATSIPSQELFARYRALPGIGPYGSAHLLAMEGRHDFIAVDSEFRRFVRQNYHGGRAVKDATMLRRYATWGRWRYLAYWSELWLAE